MEAAKAAARSIVDARPEGVVIGVVAFSDAGLAVQEPTSDQAAVLAAVERMVPSRGTSLGAGILATLDALDKARATTPPDYYSNRSPEPTATPAPVPPGSDASTLIVVLSDGENTERPDPLRGRDRGREPRDPHHHPRRRARPRARRSTSTASGSRPASTREPCRPIADRTDGTYLPAATGRRPGRASTTSWRGALVVRDEDVELTALVGALGLVLLLVAAGLSLVRGGRLP